MSETIVVKELKNKFAGEVAKMCHVDVAKLSAAIELYGIDKALAVMKNTSGLRELLNIYRKLSSDSPVAVGDDNEI